MQCGISTACFFPLDTAEAFLTLAQAGVPVTELFINTFSEIEEPYVRRLETIRQAYGIRVSSVHPFSSMIEGFFFASPYAARMEDGLALYRRYFEICRRLGADKLVFHGDHEYNVGQFSNEDYALNFNRLAQAGEACGVTLCQENVAYCRCNDVQAVHGLTPLFGEHAAFVLDVKQAARKGVGLYALLNEMGENIRQVHVSDHDAHETCLVPGDGEMDYRPFIARLKEIGFDGDLIIEVYRDNYDDPNRLCQAMRRLQAMIDGN